MARRARPASRFDQKMLWVSSTVRRGGVRGDLGWLEKEEEE